ncbi:hypothetical protein GC170_13270 [bacterium]|nr:hypothetical protein [bacterium]
MIAVKVLEGERLVRIDSQHYELPMWALERDVKLWNEEARQRAEDYCEQQKILIKDQIDAIKKRQAEDKERNRKEHEKMVNEVEKGQDKLRIDFFIRTLEPQVREIVERRVKGDDDLTREEVKRYAEEARAEVANRSRMSSVAETLKPFCITKPDHAALAVAVGKGIDPLTMTAQQAAALSPSQRKALAGIKARYQRAKR